MALLTLLHGSSQIVEKPELARGKEYNDYGRGFYCTQDEDLAREWACKNGTDGFVNRYELDTDGLQTLDLSDGAHTVLDWIALLLKYRTFRLSSSIAMDARTYLIDHFAPDVSQVDLIVGYRADDSYFQFAQSFVENTLPLRALGQALRLGNLGVQTALVSEKAFARIRFMGAEATDKNIYYPKFLNRDIKARDTYKNEIKKSASYKDDIFVLDILREEMANDDPRIQRILFE